MAITGLTISKSPAVVQEGALVSLYVAWTSTAVPHIIEINWGDGTHNTYSIPALPAYSTTYYHIYTIPDSVYVVVRVSAGASSATANLQVDVTDVAPQITAASADLDNGDGIVYVDYTFTGAAYGDTFTGTINWGDGNSDAYNLGVAGSYNASHAYASPASGGSYRRPITLTITDDEGTTDTEVFYPAMLFRDIVNDEAVGDLAADNELVYYDSINVAASSAISFGGIWYLMADAYGETQAVFAMSAFVDHTSVLILESDLECAKVGTIPFEQLIL